MARGKIVVATNTMGGKELIEDEKNGFLFNIGDSEGLRVILNKIREMSNEEKNKIREEAMRTSEEFRVSKIINKWDEIF